MKISLTNTLYYNVLLTKDEVLKALVNDILASDSFIGKLSQKQVIDGGQATLT